MSNEIVHFEPEDIEYIDTEGYTISYYAACGCLVGYWTPRRGLIDKLESSYQEENVTCKRCKQTEVYKNE